MLFFRHHKYRNIEMYKHIPTKIETTESLVRRFRDNDFTKNLR